REVRPISLALNAALISLKQFGIRPSAPFRPNGGGQVKGRLPLLGGRRPASEVWRGPGVRPVPGEARGASGRVIAQGPFRTERAYQRHLPLWRRRRECIQ